jgi:hypothetical protein
VERDDDPPAEGAASFHALGDRLERATTKSGEKVGSPP